MSKPQHNSFSSMMAKAPEMLRNTRSWMIRHRLRIGVFIMLLMVLTGIWIWKSNQLVERGSADYLFEDLNKIPQNKVGLVLGTSRFLTSGKPNPYFEYRIHAAKSLFFSGKIQYLLLSGDNRFYSYNEPREMRKELIRMGIPDSVIILDFAGFRTFDSVIRGHKVFKLKKFTVISQRFHNERAVFIARHFGIEAIAFNAQDPPEDFTLKVRLREYLARAKMVLDLFILHEEPYFLGDEHLPPGAYQ